MSVIIYWEPENATATQPFFAVPDATVSEVHRSSSKVTRHPVELGVNISDHVISDPDGLRIDSYWTNTPVELLASIGNASDRAEQAYEQMLDIQQKAYLTTIITALREYDNMVLVGLEAPRDESTGNSVRLSMSFERVTIAESQVVDAPQPATERAKPTQNLGRKNTKPASREVGGKSASLLLAIARYLAGG